MLQQSAVLYYFQCKVRQGRKGYLFALRFIIYDALLEIDIELVAVVYLFESVF
jgi:hypothetical protein